MHRYRTGCGLVAALGGDGCRAFLQGSQLPVFHLNCCRIAAGPGHSLVGGIFRLNCGGQHYHIPYLHGDFASIQRNPRHRHRLDRYLAGGRKAAVVGFYRYIRRSGCLRLQSAVLVHCNHAFIAAAPGHSLVGSVLRLQRCRQLPGGAHRQLQRRGIQFNTLDRRLANFPHRFGAGGGITAVYAADIVADAVGQGACDIGVVVQQLVILRLVAHKAAFRQHRSILRCSGNVVQTVFDPAVRVAHGVIQGAVDVGAELAAEIVEVVCFISPCGGIGRRVAVDTQEDLRLEGGCLRHTGFQHNFTAAAGIDQQHLCALCAQNGGQLGSDLTVHVVLVHPGIKAQRAHIGAAVAGVDDDPGARNAAGRIIELQRQTVAVIAGGIAAHPVGLAELQCQCVAGPGRGRKDGILGQAGKAAAGAL